jgi:hypothetical protein
LGRLCWISRSQGKRAQADSPLLIPWSSVLCSIAAVRRARRATCSTICRALQG